MCLLKILEYLVFTAYDILITIVPRKSILVLLIAPVTVIAQTNIGRFALTIRLGSRVPDEILTSSCENKTQKIRHHPYQ